MTAVSPTIARVSGGGPQEIVRRRLLVTGVVLFLAAILPALWYGLRPPSSETKATDAALSYARNYMLWSTGPTVLSTHIVPLRNLPKTIQAEVPALQRDLDVRGLVRQYGSNTRVALVVLHGVFNSLPPDEGVTAAGTVIVLVRVPSDQVLLLTR